MSSMPPLVLVHGAWHGPWSWDGFADDLRARGHEVRVVTLTGHGRPGRRSRIWPTVGRYLADIGVVMEDVGPGAILVGHSMGGYLVERYVETHPAAGLVLLAPMPRWGMGPTTIRLLRRHPARTARASATLDLWPFVATSDRVREELFGPDAPESIVEHVAERVQNESFVAFLSLLLRPVRRRRRALPSLVVAAGCDALFSVDQQRSLARARRAQLEIMARSGHDLMLDVDAAKVAALVDRWVRARSDEASAAHESPTTG